MYSRKTIRILVGVALLLAAAGFAAADCTQAICWGCFHFNCWGGGNYCECEASQYPRYCVAGGGICHVSFSP